MSTLPVRLEKQIAGKCLYSGCRADAIDGSDFCDPHDAHERGRAANRQRRHRQKVADAGMCIAGCGRKVARQRGKDGKIKRRRCAVCRKEHRKQVQNARARTRVTGEDRGVTGDAPDLRITREVEGDGYARTRFHGQERRGQQKRHQLDLQDLDDAIDRLQRAKRGVLLYVEAAAALPKVQLDDIRLEAMAQAAHAGRFIREVLGRNRYDDGEMIETDAKTRG